MKSNSWLVSIPVIFAIGVCIAIGIYVNQAVSQTGLSLTNEYHEAYRHSSNLLRDTLKFELALSDHINSCSEKSHEHLIQSLDLMFLRMNVVRNLAARLAPNDLDALSSLRAILERIDQNVKNELSPEQCKNMNNSRKEINLMFDELRQLSHRLEMTSQHKITESARVLKNQGRIIGLILSVVLIFAVIVTFLFYRQREIAREIFRLRNLLSNIINSMPASLVGVDIKGNITLWNSAAQNKTGLLEKDVKGRPLSLVSPKMAADIEKVRDSIETAGVKREQGRPVQTAEGVTYEDITIFSLQDEGAEGAVIIADDVTEKVMLQEKLNQRSKMEAIGTLAGGVAHDLNNTLSGIVSYPDLLLLNLPPHSPYRKPILTIQESGKKAAAMVDDLLTLARRGVSVTTTINLNQIVTDYLQSPECENLRSSYPNISLETHLDSQLKNIVGSPVHMMKTIMNLVSNAAESLSNEGGIRIQTENCFLTEPVGDYDAVEKGEYAVLKVVDTGAGIPTKFLHKIFEPFFTKKEMGKSGTGLGLAVVWGTINDHHGYIDVKSVEGKGTTFSVYLPVTEKLLSRADAPKSLQDLMGNKEKVLIIDDSRSQRDIATVMLKKLNYVVAAVASGEEAIVYLQEKSSDLLLLDMILENGIDGLETYEKILQFKPGQKAIITSGYAETGRVRKALRIGASSYLKKPYSLVELGEAIKTELRSDSPLL